MQRGCCPHALVRLATSCCAAVLLGAARVRLRSLPSSRPPQLQERALALQALHGTHRVQGQHRVDADGRVHARRRSGAPSLLGCCSSPSIHASSALGLRDCRRCTRPVPLRVAWASSSAPVVHLFGRASSSFSAEGRPSSWLALAESCFLARPPPAATPWLLGSSSSSWNALGFSREKDACACRCWPPLADLQCRAGIPCLRAKSCRRWSRSPDLGERFQVCPTSRASPAALCSVAKRPHLASQKHATSLAGHIDEGIGGTRRQRARRHPTAAASRGKKNMTTGVAGHLDGAQPRQGGHRENNRRTTGRSYRIVQRPDLVQPGNPHTI